MTQINKIRIEKGERTTDKKEIQNVLRNIMNIINRRTKQTKYNQRH